MDRTESYNGYAGPIAEDVKNALYNINVNIPMINYVYGLGGRDVTTGSLASVFDDMQKADKAGDVGENYRYLSVRE